MSVEAQAQQKTDEDRMQLINLLSRIDLQTKRFHYFTDDQHVHVALNDFYGSLTSLADEISEMLLPFMSPSSNTVDIPVDNDSTKSKVTQFYSDMLLKFADKNRFTKDSAVLNKIDELVGSIYILLSKLKRN